MKTLYIIVRKREDRENWWVAASYDGPLQFYNKEEADKTCNDFQAGVYDWQYKVVEVHV